MTCRVEERHASARDWRHGVHRLPSRQVPSRRKRRRTEHWRTEGRSPGVPGGPSLRLSVPLPKCLGQSRARCIRGVGVGTPYRSLRYAASSRLDPTAPRPSWWLANFGNGTLGGARSRRGPMQRGLCGAMSVHLTWLRETGGRRCHRRTRSRGTTWSILAGIAEVQILRRLA